MSEHPSTTLKKLAQANGIKDITSKELAELLDRQDELRKYRQEFHYPKIKTLPRGISFIKSLFFVTTKLGSEASERLRK